MNVVNFINDNVGWAIGEGKEISVWECRWILFENWLRKPISQISVSDLKIKDLWNNDKNWNSSILSTVFNNPF